MISAVDQLLKENQSALLRERRSVNRSPFCRPVIITVGRSVPENQVAFARDISPHGIGIIENMSRSVGTIAEIEIHSIFSRSIRVRSEMRWCEPFGKGWFVTGWTFLQE